MTLTASQAWDEQIKAWASRKLAHAIAILSLFIRRRCGLESAPPHALPLAASRAERFDSVPASQSLPECSSARPSARADAPPPLRLANGSPPWRRLRPDRSIE